MSPKVQRGKPISAFFLLQKSVSIIRVIPKKANIQYINFGDKFDFLIEIVAIFRKKIFENFQNGRSREIQIFDSFWL